jgi:colicin import membrane protein
MVASSGKVDLDTEALASLRRAAPFPIPPPGVDRTFPVRLTFRLNE